MQTIGEAATKQRPQKLKAEAVVVGEPPKVEAPRGYLKTNEAVRGELAKLLQPLLGHVGTPRYRWHLERADGAYDGSDGKVRTAQELGKRVTTVLLIEETR